MHRRIWNKEEEPKYRDIN